MAAKNYCEKADLINRLIAEGATPSAADEQAMEQVIEGVSRQIDDYCGRRFYTTKLDETRYFTAVFRDELFVDDLVSVTSLATDENGDRTYSAAWLASDYDLQPYNAALDGKPYTTIAVAPSGNQIFPARLPKGVRIVGKFGWPRIPAAAREACLVQSARLWKRKDAPFGVAGTTELGDLRMVIKSLVPRLDQDVEMLLAGLRRLV